MLGPDELGRLARTASRTTFRGAQERPDLSGSAVRPTLEDSRSLRWRAAKPVELDPCTSGPRSRIRAARSTGCSAPCGLYYLGTPDIDGKIARIRPGYHPLQKLAGFEPTASRRGDQKLLFPATPPGTIPIIGSRCPLRTSGCTRTRPVSGSETLLKTTICSKTLGNSTPTRFSDAPCPSTTGTTSRILPGGPVHLHHPGQHHVPFGALLVRERIFDEPDLLNNLGRKASTAVSTDGETPAGSSTTASRHHRGDRRIFPVVFIFSSFPVIAVPTTYRRSRRAEALSDPQAKARWHGP